MYQSPIELLTKTVSSNFAETVDGCVYKAVEELGVHVEKDELIKALRYDRHQYEQGFKDGIEVGRRRALAEMQGVMTLPDGEDDI